MLGDRISDKIGIYRMPEYCNLEIDNPIDWILAEQIMKRYVIKNMKRDFSNIKILLSDVDGVLTDAGMYYTENGDEFKKFCTYDGMGMHLLQNSGIKIGIITSEDKQIFSFRNVFKDIIVKPLFGNGGAGVFHIKPDDENLSSLVELYKTFYREPLMIQEYLPAVRQGDKRIILIDGEAVGAINRVPADGEARSNMHVGGKPMKCELTDRDREICEIIGPSLKEKGLLFVGIDVIGNYLTEINVTSPTGIKELSRFENVNIAKLIWEAIEKKL